jgi:hypothetical protein
MQILAKIASDTFFFRQMILIITFHHHVGARGRPNIRNDVYFRSLLRLIHKLRKTGTSESELNETFSNFITAHRTLLRKPSHGDRTGHDVDCPPGHEPRGAVGVNRRGLVNRVSLGDPQQTRAL